MWMLCVQSLTLHTFFSLTSHIKSYIFCSPCHSSHGVNSINLSQHFISFFKQTLFNLILRNYLYITEHIWGWKHSLRKVPRGSFISSLSDPSHTCKSVNVTLHLGLTQWKLCPGKTRNGTFSPGKYVHIICLSILSSTKFHGDFIRMKVVKRLRSSTVLFWENNQNWILNIQYCLGASKFVERNTTLSMNNWILRKIQLIWHPTKNHTAKNVTQYATQPLLLNFHSMWFFHSFKTESRKRNEKSICA